MFQIDFIAETIEEIERFVGYKIQNFISDFGGLLGLFMGCSLMSIVEVFFSIYIAILKLFPEKIKSSEITISTQKISYEEKFEKMQRDLNKLSMNQNYMIKKLMHSDCEIDEINLD